MHRRELFLALMLALVAPGAARAEQAWQVLENRWFRALTNATTERALRLVEEMDRFRIGLQVVTNARMPPDEPPVLVVIFDTMQEFRKYAGSRNIGGFAVTHVPGLSGMTIVVPARGSRQDELQTIRHEYVHALNKHRLVRFPGGTRRVLPRSCHS